MRFEKFLIAFVIFTAIVTTGVFMIGDINTNYNLAISTSEFGDVYNTTAEMYNLSKDMKDQTIEGDISDTDSWESMTKGSYSAIRLVKNSFNLYSNIINAIGKTLQIPGYFIQLAIIALLISIVLTIVYIVMRFQPR
jgi:preprotein translocase subunit SecF